jgi:hypothetical protein
MHYHPSPYFVIVRVAFNRSFVHLNERSRFTIINRFFKPGAERTEHAFS